MAVAAKANAAADGTRAHRRRTLTSGWVTDAELLDRYEPIVRFNDGEYFLPASVDAFVARAELWERSGPQGRRLVAAAGSLDLDGLVAATREHTAQHFLRLVSEPLSQAELVAWRVRVDRPRFRAETRLGHVGVLARLVDAGGRLSLVFRGRVPAGAQAAAARLDRDRPDHGDHPYYGRVLRSAGYIVVQYWLFSFFNDWRSRAHGFNDHEGDWEQVTVFLADKGQHAAEPRWVAFSSHDTAGADLRRRWDDPDLTLVGDHPVVHAGLGSHAGAFLAGEYLTAVRGTRLASAAGVARRMSRRLLPWTQDRLDDHGVGIPYVDFKRGDGESIGAGQPRRWRPVVIDDETPWVREYSGLWGDDTEDRFGGERGPAGPRYERDGSVRRSWFDPVGWAALDAVVPDDDERRAVAAARVDELTAELAAIRAERDATRGRLRAAVVGGAIDTATELDALAALAGREAMREDEQRRLRETLTRVVTPSVAPHAHLRHRPLPIPPDPRGRRRLLRVWSTVSTPLLFVLLGLLVVSRGRSIMGLVVPALLIVLTIEAAARGRLLGFVVRAFALVVLASIVGAIVAGLVANWRVTSLALFLAAAIASLVVNLRELMRS